MSSLRPSLGPDTGLGVSVCVWKTSFYCALFQTADAPSQHLRSDGQNYKNKALKNT